MRSTANYLALARQYTNDVRGWWAAEKLDGWQGLWTGERLLSRTGKTLNAPAWWLDSLPAVQLQGELFTERNDRAHLVSIVGNARNDWSGVTFHVFDAPNQQAVAFRDTYDALREFENRVVKRIRQVAIPLTAEDEFLAAFIGDVKAVGGEGLVVRDPSAFYSEAWNMLKYKPLDDAEGTVEGYVTGKGKFLGMVGALVLRLANGARLRLSGLSCEERALTDSRWAAERPGTECPEWIEAPHFPRGAKVTFQYHGESSKGIPIHASFLRRYDFA